jgi:hypothetical protein
MRMKNILVAVVALSLGIAGATAIVGESGGQTPPAAKELRPAATFASIADQRARAIALFEEAGKIMMHPRCVNCHPATERPRQGDAMRPHQPLVVRGKDGNGAAGMTCNTCHHATNFNPARIPGNDHWALAPASMAWEGQTIGQICEQIKDRTRNGNRDMAAILRHVVTDTLILWAWAPGEGRAPVPGTNAEFAALLRAWADAGAHCPGP